MSNLTRSIIRSVTPIVVGFGASLLAHIGISQPAVVAAIGSAVAIAYGSIIRVIEQKHPKVGALLGAIGAPTYLSPSAISAALVPEASISSKISSPAANSVATVPDVAGKDIPATPKA